MNKLINDLRLDAGISRIAQEPYLCVVNKEGKIIDPLKGLELFSELIVKECATTIQDFVDHRIPVSEYASRLKKHFKLE